VGHEPNLTNAMSPETRFDPTPARLPEAVREVARIATDAAEEAAKSATTAFGSVNGVIENVATDVSDAASRAVEAGKDLYQTAALKADDVLSRSKDYVSRKPVRVVLGAVAFGAAIGYLFATRVNSKPNSCHADEPLIAVRDAILSVTAPVARHVQAGYGSAKDQVENVTDRARRLNSARNGRVLLDTIERMSNRLKFW